MRNLIIGLIIGAAIIVGFLASRTQEAVEEVVAPETDLAKQPLPQSCVDELEGTPVITSLSTYTLTPSGTFTVNGCNFSGFEGDKDVWIVNENGVKGILHGDQASTDKLISLKLQPKICQQNNSYSGNPCTAWLDIVSGIYKIYTEPWGKKSNEVLVEIKDAL